MGKRFTQKQLNVLQHAINDVGLEVGSLTPEKLKVSRQNEIPLASPKHLYLSMRLRLMFICVAN